LRLTEVHDELAEFVKLGYTLAGIIEISSELPVIGYGGQKGGISISAAFLFVVYASTLRKCIKLGNINKIMGIPMKLFFLP
jgi:hypothetical protein